MIEKEIKEFIEKNKDKLPLSYHLDLTFRKNDVELNLRKTTTSIKYYNSEYLIQRFYKSISRF